MISVLFAALFAAALGAALCFVGYRMFLARCLVFDFC